MDNREAQFAANIAMGMPQAAAARTAGYRAGMSTELMRRPEIQQEILAQTQNFSKELILSRNDVLTGLLDAIQDAKLQGDATPQIAGWREVGRIIGCYAPEEKKVSYSGDISVIQKRVMELSDERLHEYTTIEGEVVPELEAPTTFERVKAKRTSSAN